MRYGTYVVIVCMMLPFSIQAAENRGLQLAIGEDHAAEHVRLYEDSHALIIGVDEYTEGWPDLPGVKYDVQAVQGALEEQGFHVIVEKNPTFEQLGHALTDFIHQYAQQPNSRVLVYFAGHGHTLTLAWGGGNGLYCPVRCPKSPSG